MIEPRKKTHCGADVFKRAEGNSDRHQAGRVPVLRRGRRSGHGRKGRPGTWEGSPLLAEMTFKTSFATSLRGSLLVLTLGFSACVFDRQVKDTEPASDGPTVYGKVSVSVDHVSTR